MSCQVTAESQTAIKLTLIVTAQLCEHQAIRADRGVVLAIAACLSSEHVMNTAMLPLPRELTLKASTVSRLISSMGRLNFTTGAVGAESANSFDPCQAIRRMNILMIIKYILMNGLH